MSKGWKLPDSCIFMFYSINLTLIIHSGMNYSKTVQQMSFNEFILKIHGSCTNFSNVT